LHVCEWRSVPFCQTYFVVPELTLFSLRHSGSPYLGFANGEHVDGKDKLTAEQVGDLRAEVSEELLRAKKRHVKADLRCFLRLLDHDNFCLPTTCGYQFLSKDGAHDGSAFFSMGGLGMAMPVEDGVFHHFMGSMFAHHTCLPLLHRQFDNTITASNCDDSFLILGWGSNGGSQEMAARRSALAGREFVPGPTQGERNRYTSVASGDPVRVVV